MSQTKLRRGSNLTCGCNMEFVFKHLYVHITLNLVSLLRHTDTDTHVHTICNRAEESGNSTAVELPWSLSVTFLGGKYFSSHHSRLSVSRQDMLCKSVRLCNGCSLGTAAARVVFSVASLQAHDDVARWNCPGAARSDFCSCFLSPVSTPRVGTDTTL